MSNRRWPVSPTCAIAALSLIALLFVSCGSPEGNRSGSKPNKPTKPAQVDPVDLMNTEEKALYNQVSFEDCVPLRRAARRMGAVAALKCDATEKWRNGKRIHDTKTWAVYFRFETRGEAVELYSQRLDQLRSSGSEATIDYEAGWCVTTFSLCYADQGRVVFYRKADHVFVEWSAPKKIYARAERFDSKMGELKNAWWHQW